MKNIVLKRILPDSPDAKLVALTNDLSFPPKEHLEAEELYSFGETDSRVYGIYTGDVFHGFFRLMVVEACVYICYFAILPESRGNGIGSAALKALLEQFDGYQIVVDFEAYNETGAKNVQERLRRRSFYLRNGFYETGKYMFYMQTEFEVASSWKPMNVRTFQKVLDMIHEGAEDFPGIMYEKSDIC